VKRTFRNFLCTFLLCMSSVCFAASANLTTIPTASQIIDSNGGIWTVNNGLCYLNGVQASDCSYVQTLLWDNGNVYAYNVYGQWYIWNGDGWGLFAQDPRTASASGATVPPATQLIDSNGGVWTVGNALCYLNGVQADGCSNVQTLLWYSGQMYVNNFFGQWYIWNGDGWGLIAQDPRPSAASPMDVSASGTTIPAAKQIIDSSGGVWTVSGPGGVCYRNGVQAGGCSNVASLLWYGGHLYVYNTYGQWWLWNGSSWGAIAGNPWATSPSATTAVLTHHNDNLRTGWNKTETTLTPQALSSATSKFGLVATVGVDDEIDAQPLVVPQQSITCAANQTSICQPGAYQVVYVATESNTVYAINAANGAILLQRNFGSPVPTPIGCNNSPNVGITGTPVIDPNKTTLYFIVYTATGPGSAPSHTLHAVNLTDLTDRVSPTTVAASGRSKGGSIINFNSTYEKQRAALLLSNGVVYAGFGSHCDFGANQSRGWLLGWNATNLAPLPANQLDNELSTSPNNFFMASIWMSGSGVATDDGGNLWFATGNSDPSGTTYDGVYNIEQSIVRVGSALGGVGDIFTPSNWGQLDGGDVDLGAGGVVKILPQAASSPPLLAGAGKDGRMFLLNSSNMGGYTPGGPDKAIAEVNIGQCWCGLSHFIGQDGIGRIVSSGGYSTMVWKINQPTSGATQLVAESSTPFVGSYIIDASGNVWTIGGPGESCFINGVQAGACSLAQTLLYYNGQIYVEDESGNWWLWEGTNFALVGADPRTTSAAKPNAPPTQSVTPLQDGGFFTSVSSNGQGPAVVWAVGRPTSAASPILTLYAYAATPSNGTLPLLYSSPAGAWTNLNGNANSVPVVANGQVYVAGYQVLSIFGLAAP
jgi:hypothetical protein